MEDVTIGRLWHVITGWSNGVFLVSPLILPLPVTKMQRTLDNINNTALMLQSYTDVHAPTTPNSHSSRHSDAFVWACSGTVRWHNSQRPFWGTKQRQKVILDTKKLRITAVFSSVTKETCSLWSESRYTPFNTVLWSCRSNWLKLWTSGSCCMLDAHVHMCL